MATWWVLWLVEVGKCYAPHWAGGYAHSVGLCRVTMIVTSFVYVGWGYIGYLCEVCLYFLCRVSSVIYGGCQ